MLATLTQQTRAIAIADTTAKMIDLWLYGKATNTQSAYRRDLDAFNAFVEGKPVERWTVNDLQGFGSALAQQGLKQNTVNRKLLAVKSLLSYAQRTGLVQLNPGSVVPTQRTKETTTERILSEGEVSRLIYDGTDKPADRALLKLLYATGCRVSELCGLKWSDAGDRGDAVQLTVFGKGDKTRYVLIRRELWAEVEVATGKRGEYVFSTRNGKPYDRQRVHRLVARAAADAGIEGKVSPHWLRHSHASHSLDRGCPVHTVQRSLGHSSIETTQRYLHARPEDGSGLHLAV